MYKAVIFDFDYTLGDFTNGIVLSINHALEKLGFRVQDTKTIQRTIGLSLKDTLFELTGIQDEETAQKFTQYFKEKADEVMVDNTRLYEGVLAMLKKLRAAAHPSIPIIDAKSKKIHHLNVIFNLMVLKKFLSDTILLDFSPFVYFLLQLFFSCS